MEFIHMVKPAQNDERNIDGKHLYIRISDKMVDKVIYLLQCSGFRTRYTGQAGNAWSEFEVESYKPAKADDLEWTSNLIEDTLKDMPNILW